MTHDLKTSLDDFAETAYADAPPSTVDIGKARADGRRRTATARLTTIGGGVAVVAACALVVNTLGGASPAGKADPHSPAAGHAFTGTDPLTTIGRFGYLPDGFQTVGWNTGDAYGNAMRALTKPPTTDTTPRLLPGMLTLSKWDSPPKPSSANQTTTPTTVKGSPKAYIVTTPGDGPRIPADLRLFWQTASGSWFELGGNYSVQVHGAEQTALLTRVAESVAEQDAPVALPIHVEGLPKGVALGLAMLNDPVVVGQGRFDAVLMYHTGGAPNKDASFSISVAPVASAQGDPVTPNSLAQPPGAPVMPADPQAPQSGDPSGSPAGQASNACKDEKGLHICVHDTPANGVDTLASVGGPQGLLDRITSLGTDRKDWTTHVVN